MTMNELKILAAVALAVVLGASAAPQETAGGLRYFTRAALESADMGGIAEYIDATLTKCPAAFAAAENLAATRAGRERDALLLRVELARNLEAYVRAYHTRKPEARDRKLLAWQGAKEMGNFLAYFEAERLRGEARAHLIASIIQSVHKTLPPFDILDFIKIVCMLLTKFRVKQFIQLLKILYREIQQTLIIKVDIKIFIMKLLLNLPQQS